MGKEWRKSTILGSMCNSVGATKPWLNHPNILILLPWRGNSLFPCARPWDATEKTPGEQGLIRWSFSLENSWGGILPRKKPPKLYLTPNGVWFYHRTGCNAIRPLSKNTLWLPNCLYCAILAKTNNMFYSSVSWTFSDHCPLGSINSLPFSSYKKHWFIHNSIHRSSNSHEAI